MVYLILLNVRSSQPKFFETPSTFLIYITNLKKTEVDCLDGQSVVYKLTSKFASQKFMLNIIQLI